MMTSIQAEHGRLDILVHNAAAALAPKPFLKLDWSRDVMPPLEVACRGLLNCLQEAEPLLGARTRVVVLLTDALFHRPPVQMGAYLAAKGALWGIARAAAKEMQRRGVTFAFVSPGMTKTELLGAYGDRALELFAQDHPLGRLAEPEEIAAAIGALIEGPEYLHGANLLVNGGIDY
jgi:3-oxoacyl-[acyl-carrier protein] reductase